MNTYELVETTDALRAAAQRLAGEPLLAVDTEAAGFHRYHDRVSLVQISSRRENLLVDPLAVKDFSPVAPMLEDPDVETVLHDADYDFRILDRDLGVRVRGLFDTQVAAAFLGDSSLGLGAVLQAHLEVHVPKKFQRADWAARPLSEEMRAYAVTDTAYLPPLRDRLRAALEARGRLGWADEEFREREKIRWSDPNDRMEAFLRIKGARDLPPRGLAILREVHGWREELARTRDRAAFRVLGNRSLLEMSARPPATPAGLGEINGVSPGIIRQHGGDLLAAVQRGLEIPDGELPSFPRGPRRHRDPEVEERTERMRRARNRRAEALGLDPGFLISRATLAEIARRRPDTTEALREVAGVRAWQVDALGDALLTALRDG